MKRNGFWLAVVWAAVGAIFVSLAMAIGQCEAALPDCFDATARVFSVQGKRLGTGTCCSTRPGGTVWIMTNAHVVGGNKTVYCQFWRNGHESKYAWPAKVEYSRRDDLADIAYLSIPEKDFGGYPPTAIYLAEPGAAPKPGEMIYSIGCLQGAWPTAFRGHVLRYEGPDMRFLPVGGGGRSGSAMFNAAGTRIVGLLYARTKDDTEGIAMSLASIHKVWKTPSQCPGGQCPIPGQSSSDRRFSPFGRFRQPQPQPKQTPRLPFKVFRPGESEDPYPGLPPAERSPIVPPVPIPFSAEDDLPPAPPSEEAETALPPLPADDLPAFESQAKRAIEDLTGWMDELRTQLKATESRLQTAESYAKGLEEKIAANSRLATEAADGATGDVEAAAALANSKFAESLKPITERINKVSNTATSARLVAERVYVLNERIDAVKGVAATAVETAATAAETAGKFGDRIDRVESRLASVWGWITGLSWPVIGAIGLALFVLWRRIESKRGLLGKIKGGEK